MRNLEKVVLGLHYTQNASGNNQGGLKARKTLPKQVAYHQSMENPSQCPIRFPIQVIPQQVPNCHNVFYFKLLKMPMDDCQFTVQPLGHNSLKAGLQYVANALQRVLCCVEIDATRDALAKLGLIEAL